MVTRSNRCSILVLTVFFAAFGVAGGYAQESAPGEQQAPTDERVQRFYVGMDAGYWAGLGGAAQLSVLNLTEAAPLGLHLHGGYFHVFDPGNAEDARRIFINDNQGGTIEKSGRNVLLGFEISYEMIEKPGFEVLFVAGPRFSSFSGRFQFIGDNEDFRVTSNQWGLGAGGALNLSATPTMSVRLIAGADYFFPARLEGHGQYSYTPDGVDDTPRNDYTWKDANKAINQPGLTPRVGIGVHFLVFE